MKTSMFVLLVAMLAMAGCSADETGNPTAPADTSYESQFPVNEEFAGQETAFASKIDPTATIYEIARDSGFTKLVAAVDAAGLEATLRSEGPFTVFAPTDAAFDKLPEGLLDALLLEENQDALTRLLLYHVVEGQVTSRDLRFYQKVPTVEGGTLDILRFFRLVLVNGVRVTTADILATNGVVHVIDEVLVPEGFTLEQPEEPTLNLAELAQAAGLTKLVELVGTAGLVDAVTGEDPLTVFAPTNDAFAALPEGLLGELSMPENAGLLQELLLYHVTGGQILSSDLRRYQFVEMLAGGSTFVYRTWSGDIRVNRALVVTPDALAANGVAHVIDRVLIPLSFYGLLESLPEQAPEFDAESVSLGR